MPKVQHPLLYYMNFLLPHRKKPLCYSNSILNLSVRNVIHACLTKEIMDLIFSFLSPVTCHTSTD
uniref:Uncharacterized protein n=1 Tax=Arundo donax TaxID=35708 RepID=A0A0A9CF92_ARUDO